MTGRRIAAFDFDGTLTQRDTLMGFLARTFGRRTLAAAIARVAPLAVQARTGRSTADLHHRDASKAALLRELCEGFDEAAFARAGEAYSATLDRRLRPEMVEQVAWHRSAGHELVIVSASLQTYLAPFGEAHGFDQVIGVELEAEHGALTGRLAGPNVRGPEKAVRLEKWLAGDQPELLWAYGNSSGDRELLAMADVPVWVAGRRRTARPPAPQ